MKKVSLIVLISAILWLLLNYRTLGGIPYVDQFVKQSPYTSNVASADPWALMARIVANVKAYWKAVPETILYRTCKIPSGIFSALFLLLLGCGFVYSLLKERTIVEYYVFFYAVLFLLYVPINYENVQRYVVPLIPFILYYFMQGIRQFGLWISHFGYPHDGCSAACSRRVVLKSVFTSAPTLSIAVICMLILSNFSSTVQASVLKTQAEMFDYYVGENWEDYKRMAMWTREHTPPESIVIARVDLPFHFWSHRRVTWYPSVDPQAGEEQVLQSIMATQADYIALDSLKRRQTAAQKSIMRIVQQSPDRFQLVYQDRGNRVYRILPEAWLSQGQ